MSLRFYLRNMLKCIRHGGVTYVNVSFVNPSERYVGKKVFVSGGSEGLGRAMAEAYLQEGAEVIVTGRKKEKLERLENEVNNSNLHTCVWDATDFGSYPAKFEEVVSVMGGGGYRHLRQ